MPNQVRELHEILLDLAGIMNEPQRDDALIGEAGIALDRALFPLLVRIQRRGPLGVVELANLAGRDHTTVSRQVAKLEELGLVTRREGRQDKRVREVAVTRKGLAMTDALDKARERLVAPRLAKWSARDRADLLRLMRKLVDSARE
ncbi:MAG TPA: MarR family transcriptional regulator [Rhizomicrobium sp.]|nr:MarR family transcriptional regulator [Rhizomicrobium sp.]